MLTFLQYIFLTVFLLFQTKNNALSGLQGTESIRIFLITLQHSSISRFIFHSLFEKRRIRSAFFFVFLLNKIINHESKNDKAHQTRFKLV